MKQVEGDELEKVGEPGKRRLDGPPAFTPRAPGEAVSSLGECGARRLYEVSRDCYAPALVAFAVRWLGDLAERPDSVAVCLGRDGIAPFVAARRLLQRYPQHFRQVHPRRVQLAYISRPLAKGAASHGEQAALLKRHLCARGADGDRPLILVDVGIHGSIQDCLQWIYPGREVRGHYLVLRRRAGDSNGARKHGFLADLDVASREARGSAPGAQQGDVLRRGDAFFLRSRSIHVLEDLWSGPGGAAAEFRVSRWGGQVEVTRGAADEGPDRPPPLTITPAERALLKRAALRGVADGAARRESQGDPEATFKLAAWFRELEAPAALDAYLLNALVRGNRR